jgi:SAM-dependent methyltransferase
MREIEATTIDRLLLAIDTSGLSPCINVGSSTGAFRSEMQPHNEILLNNLRRRGIVVLNNDIRPDSGVDLVGDLTDETFRESVRRLRPRLLLCNNVLEHVPDAAVFARACEDVLQPGGYLCVTVPFSYPYHADPIDTLLRPSPAALAALFPRCRLLESAILVDDGLHSDLRRKGISSWRYVAGSLVRPFMFWRDRHALLYRLHSLFWLFRPYKVSLCLLQRTLP